VIICIKNCSCWTLNTSVFLDTPKFRHKTNLTFFTIVVRFLRRTRYKLSLSDRHRCAILSPVIHRREVCIMWFPSTLSESRVRLLVLRTMSTLFGKNIEDRLWLWTDDTCFSIKERFIQRTVGNVMISDISLVILLDQIINILIT